MTYHFSLDGGIKVLWALCIPFLWLFSTFSLPNICNYSVVFQILDVTTKIYRNFYRKVLPQSRNGRKLQTQPPEKNALTSSLDNISRISALSQGSRYSSPASPAPYDNRKGLPYFQNFSLNAADIIIGVGYDLMDLFELTNQALGGLILFQISCSWILTLFHMVMFLSIFRPVIFTASVYSGKTIELQYCRVWCRDLYGSIHRYVKTYQFFQLVLKSEDMLLAFCIGHFIAGCVSAYRIFALSNGCHNLMYEIKEAKKSLNELTILKYKVKLVKSRIFY